MLRRLIYFTALYIAYFQVVSVALPVDVGHRLPLAFAINTVLHYIQTNNNSNDMLLQTHGPYHRHKSTKSV